MHLCSPQTGDKVVEQMEEAGGSSRTAGIDYDRQLYRQRMMKVLDRMPQWLYGTGKRLNRIGRIHH